VSNEAYIDGFLRGVGEIAQSISRTAIDRVIEVLFRAWRDGRTVFTAGNGGSAGTASHLAADLNKVTAIPGRRRMRVISLVDNISLVSALVNDDGWENVYVEQLINFFQPGDVFVAISVHGGSGRDKAGAWSQNLLKAMQYAKDHGGTAVGLAGFDGGAMKALADACIVVPYNTTPHVEAFHVVLHHLVAFCLAEKIRDHREPLGR
jgi:D-sedoheptulose 7-phosphate isomerase